MKRYITLFAVQISTFALWAWKALPDMNEQGSLVETLKWLGMQALVAVFLILLLARASRVSRWLVVVYAGFVALFGYGTLGWSLIGAATPLSVYSVAVLFIVNGLALLFHALKDLNIGRERKESRFED